VIHHSPALELEALMTWRTGQAYSQDLRDRVLAAVDGGLRMREVAPLFRVSIAYIYKALERRAATGETRPFAAAGRRILGGPGRPHHARPLGARLGSGLIHTYQY
jgi:hypothetical protein